MSITKQEYTNLCIPNNGAYVDNLEAYLKHLDDVNNDSANMELEAWLDTQEF